MEEKKVKVVETEEYKALKRTTSTVVTMVKHLWTVPIGIAGLLFLLVAIVATLSNLYGSVLALGFGFWFIVKAKKELKAKGVDLGGRKDGNN